MTPETTSVGSSGESLTLDSFNAVKALLTNMQAIEFSFFSGAKASLQTYVDQLNVQIEAESKKILTRFQLISRAKRKICVSLQPQHCLR